MSLATPYNAHICPASDSCQCSVTTRKILISQNECWLMRQQSLTAVLIQVIFLKADLSLSSSASPEAHRTRAHTKTI